MVALSLAETIYILQNRISILNKLCETKIKEETQVYFGFGKMQNIDDPHWRLIHEIRDNRPFVRILEETEEIWQDLKKQFMEIVEIIEVDDTLEMD